MDWQKTAENMKKRGFTVRRYATGAEAAEALCEELKGQEIGMGGSVTAAQLGLPEKLEAAGCTVYARGRSWDRKDTDKGVTAPVYISSANGVAETGELVNIDGTGNRVAATLYGPEKVYFIVGLNKLAPTLEAAIWRARNIASPLNAKRLNRRTPCASASSTRRSRMSRCPSSPRRTMWATSCPCVRSAGASSRICSIWTPIWWSCTIRCR